MTSLPDWLAQRARITPERTALVAGGRSVGFAELETLCGAAAARLAAAGVRQGDRVALLSDNSFEMVVAIHAVARLRAVLLPLNLRLAPAELAYQLEDAAASFIVHDAADAAAARDAVAAAAADPRLVALETIVSAQAPASPPPPAPRIDLEAVHSVIYTSGTTGRPKGVQLTYGNHFWSAAGSALHLGLEADDRWLACMPLFHVGGLAIVLRGLIYGIAIEVHERFDEAAVNRSLDENGVTLLSVVSTMLQRMLDERGGRRYPPRLRAVLVGGGPVPVALLEEALAQGLPVVQTYGLTETDSQVATLAPSEALAKLGSAGRALFGNELRIVREDGTACEPDEPGEITLRGPSVTRGYLNRPEATAAAVRDGWLHTGDLGTLDAAGYLYVLDRRDDLIVSGGENVYPAEVEAVLESHAAVLEAAVFGLPDERWGQAVSAVVRPSDGAAVSEADLQAFCRERLAGYKTPRRIELRAAPLPRTASGKLLRRELRENRPAPKET